MPCRDPDWYGQSVDNPVSVELKEKVNNLTQLLCRACSILDNKGFFTKYPHGELEDWYREHQAADRARVEASRRAFERAQKEKRRKGYLESVRDRLMSELTDDEKEALGL